MPERGGADTEDVEVRRARVHRVETRGDGIEQHRGIVLDAAVRRDGRLVRHAMEGLGHRTSGRVVETGARGRGADVDGDHHAALL